jgi:NTE family protein
VSRVALALGSGGARGYAHIGVIQVLEEGGFDIVAVAGSSMGSVVGGVYAAGYLDPYTEWVRTLKRVDVMRMLDPSLSAPGAIKADRIVDRVGEFVDGANIEELPIIFTAVATDLFARREVWFTHGRLDAAIRASIAIPGIFTPVELDGRVLVDGGVMNPVPIAPLGSVPCEVVVAVSLNGEHRGQQQRGPVRETALRAVASRMGLTTDDEEIDEAPSTPGGLDVVNLSLETMQAALTRFCLAAYPPDVLITVPKDACRTFDFHRADEMIELGRELAVEALDRSEVTGRGLG